MEQARLEFTDASGQPQVVEVVETSFRIGRSHGNHLVLPGTEVSHAHAEIVWDGQQFLLRDCQSRAGTFVNNERIGQRVLTGGDRIRADPRSNSASPQASLARTRTPAPRHQPRSATSGKRPLSSRVSARWATRRALAVCLFVITGVVVQAEPLNPATADRFARLALDCVHREYPNKIAHVLSGDADVRPPRELTPAFYGCYDWHSAVHAHWLLARLLRLAGNGPFAAAARQALGQSLTIENIEVELLYVRGSGRTSFERPYGLAWVLQLAAELHEWRDDHGAARWLTALAPLEREAAQRIKDWLPKLTYPIRSGEHSQTAFAFGLMLDWARVAGDREMQRLIRSLTEDYYGRDTMCPMAYEPSGQDFLSPCLAEADLMRRVQNPYDFAAWLTEFLPSVPAQEAPRGVGWLEPAVVTDPSDGKLAHLDGLNLSRAWMLEGIVTGLPPNDSRRLVLQQTAQHHRTAGLAAVTGEHYAGGHWLASFATYLVTGRGLP